MSDKMDDTPNDVNSSKGASQDQSEDSRRNTLIDIEGLPPVGKHASKNQYLPSPRQEKVSSRFSSQPSTSSFQAPDIDLLEKTNADVQPSRELYSGNCSRNDLSINLDSLHSERRRTVFEPFNPSRPDELLPNSRFLLSCVLRRMMLYNGEYNWLGRFEAHFAFLTNSFTESVSQRMCLEIGSYLKGRADNYIKYSSINFQMTAEAFTQMIYEKLLASVVGTLTFILSVPITREFSEFVRCYSDFRSLYAEFLDESSKYNVDDLQAEASRNRVKEQQKMIHLLMLEALQALQLLLMYVGENSDAASIQTYEFSVKDEDKMYLRRHIG